MPEGVLDDVLRGGESALDVADRARAVVHGVAAELGVKERGAVRERALHVDDVRERLVVDLDELGAVLGLVAARGEDESDLMIPIELGVRWVNDKADADWGALFQVRDRVTYRADEDKKVRNDWSVGVGLSLFIGG